MSEATIALAITALVTLVCALLANLPATMVAWANLRHARLNATKAEESVKIAKATEAHTAALVQRTDENTAITKATDEKTAALVQKADELQDLARENTAITKATEDKAVVIIEKAEQIHHVANGTLSTIRTELGYANTRIQELDRLVVMLEEMTKRHERDRDR